jgi:hypothetical protein
MGGGKTEAAAERYQARADYRQRDRATFRTPLLQPQLQYRTGGTHWTGYARAHSHQRRSVVLPGWPEQACAAGQSMELLSNLSKAVFFDPATEKRIV